MPGGYKNINGNDGNTFSSTNQPANKGRKKKILTILKENGYGKEDIHILFQELPFSTVPELKKISQDDTKPTIVRIVANQLLHALKKGDYNKIKEIMEHLIGKPVQHTDNTHTVNEPMKIKIGDKDFTV